MQFNQMTCLSGLLFRMTYPSSLLCDGFGHHTGLISLEQVKPRLLRVQVLDHAWHVNLG